MRGFIRPVTGILLIFILATGCAQDAKQIRKLTKPIDQTAEQIVKVREMKSDSGATRAVISPADEKQLKFPF